MKSKDVKHQNKHVTTLDQILDRKYGKRGAVKREHWERVFEVFYLSVVSEQNNL